MARFDVLLVEDNPGDIKLTQKAFEKSAPASTLHVVTDGEIALNYIFQRPPFEEAPRPDLVLLDINLPKVGGAEVLRAVKSDSDLRRIPVVMLTSSDREADVRNAYDLHANSYVTKPPSFGQLVELVEHLQEYWFGVVRRPGHVG
ncbi:MAG: response regulator [Myxococcota bacterium]